MIDQADRRALGTVTVLAATAFFGIVGAAAAVGLGVRVFIWLSGV